MEWYDNYLIGVEHVDKQHQELVKIISRLQDNISSGNALAEIANALRFLVEYTKTHFKDEENFMLGINFDEYDHHKELHKKLLNDVAAILIDLKHGKKIEMYSLVDFLTDWLLNHIQQEDQKIGRFFERMQAG